MKRLWKGEIFTVCCFGTCGNVYKQTERKCYLLPVINPMKLIETVFQRLVCHQLSVVHWVMSDKLYKHQCLLSLCRPVRCGVRQCCITHSLSMRDCIHKSACNDIDRSTHLLLVIWCTMGSFTKIKIELCHSLPVDYGTRLLITKGSITHILLSWDNISYLC